VRGPILYLSLSEAHDKHGPEPDIGKYDRQMPNVPEQSAAFDVTFEPEEYLVSGQGPIWRTIVRTGSTGGATGTVSGRACGSARVSRPRIAPGI
jgi:hypothetical protein